MPVRRRDAVSRSSLGRAPQDRSSDADRGGIAGRGPGEEHLAARGGDHLREAARTRGARPGDRRPLGGTPIGTDAANANFGALAAATLRGRRRGTLEPAEEGAPVRLQDDVDATGWSAVVDACRSPERAARIVG